jgi:transcriptional regulator with XRE-family HTH domain
LNLIKVTQVQVAERWGKPQSFISKYERGERRLDLTEFIELADVLGIDAVDFINRYQSAITQITVQKSRRVKKNK